MSERHGVRKAGRADPRSGNVSAWGQNPVATRIEVRQAIASKVDSLDHLQPAIESEIIPRLMMAFQACSDAAPAGSTPVVSGTDVDALTELVLHHDVVNAARHVQELHRAGASLDSLYLDVITGAARQLGDLWVEDECSFFDVTVGVSRLQQIMLEFSPTFCRPRRRLGMCQHTALIAPLPGEQHTFGQFMVVEFFRRAGWSVRAASPGSVSELAALVHEQHFDVVGLSVSADRFLDQLDPAVQQIREASCHDQLKVLIGGRSVAVRDGLAAELNVDATASDAQSAVDAADRLVNA